MIIAMENLLELPEKTLVNKVVPKNAFYKRMEPERLRALQNYMTDEVEKIYWLYKLHPATLNVAPGEKVEEIDVFVLHMKHDHYSLKPLQDMDSLLPRHTLFIIDYGVSRDLVIHYKQMTTVKGQSVWKLGNAEIRRHVDMGFFDLHFEGLTMDTLYEKMIGQISGLHTASAADYKVAAELRAQIEGLQKQVLSLQKQISKEKQFNRQVEMNTEARKLKKEISALEVKLKEYGGM